MLISTTRPKWKATLPKLKHPFILRKVSLNLKLCHLKSRFKGIRKRTLVLKHFWITQGDSRRSLPAIGGKSTLLHNVTGLVWFQSLKCDSVFEEILPMQATEDDRQDFQKNPILEWFINNRTGSNHFVTKISHFHYYSSQRPKLSLDIVAVMLETVEMMPWANYI